MWNLEYPKFVTFSSPNFEKNLQKRKKSEKIDRNSEKSNSDRIKLLFTNVLDMNP